MATFTNTVDNVDIAAAFVSLVGLADGDTVRFNQKSTIFTTNLNAFAAVNLAAVLFVGQFAGGSTAAFQLGVNSGSGLIEIRCTSQEIILGPGATTTHKEVLVKFTGSGGRVVNNTGFTTETVKLINGLWRSQDGHDTNIVYATGGQMLLELSTTKVTNDLYLEGGQHVSYRRVQGHVEVGPAAALTIDAEYDVGAAAKIFRIQGKYVHKAKDIPGVFDGRPGGVADFSQVRQNVIIAGGTIWEGFRIIGPPAGFTLTWTAQPTKVGDVCQFTF